MISSFENFQSKFIEEALDNINDLEKALLELELSPGNKELIERVFRAMHSLKGGGAMFGFNRLSEFTHRMENIYDLVRSGQIQVSPNLLSVTLKSVDLLKDLLNPALAESIQVNERLKKLAVAIDDILKIETQMLIASVGNRLTKAEESNTAVNQMGTYYIHFYPGKHVLENGTNLLYLLDELHGLGQVYAISGVRSVPSLEELNPLHSYIFWDIFVATDQGQNAISDVFIFVEDDSTIEIHKISSSNLLDNANFVDRLNDLSGNQNEIELSDLSDFLGESQIATSTCQQQSEPVYASVEELKARGNSSIRVSSEKIDGLMNLVSELVISQERLNMIVSRYQIAELKMVTENIQKLTGQLRDSAFSISLIPVESLLTRFQRLVRDLSGELGKQVSFTATGTDTELDKTMIESLTDPLLHIIRNSIGHGIEMPDERQRKGKQPCGKISLNAFYSGANVVIQVIDDGAGIDAKKIRKKAIEKGFIKAGGDLSDEDALKLIFLPGFSTSSTVTEVSGRGVGMDVVNRNIAAIRGEVAIDSEPDKGTTISITLPLVLSIIDGLLVRINQTLYVIPLSLTDRIYPVDPQLLNRNFINLINLDGVQYPFFNLRQELDLGGNPPARCQMVVVNHSEMRVALAVDQVLGKIQAVLKPLGRLYHDQKMISAATIMGDGTIALVLDTNAIIKQLSHQS